MKKILFVLLAFHFVSIFGQSEIIDKAFKNLSVEKRSQLEIVDTIPGEIVYFDAYYYYEYEAEFEREPIQNFYVYQNKELNKKGLIVLGVNESVYTTDAIADSIYLIGPDEFSYFDKYDENGEYLGTYYKAAIINFSFLINGSENLYSLTNKNEKYSIDKSGLIKRTILKAVSFSGLETVTGVFVDLNSDKVVNSSVLNESLVQTQVYAYKYDSYYYGEYDYGYENSELDYELPIYETRLNYEPVEILYLEKNDTISKLISFDYKVFDESSYLRKVLPASYAGVWKTTESDTEPLIIIDEDEIYQAYGLLYSTIDGYDFFKYKSSDLSSIINTMNLNSEQKTELESKWKGDKNKVNVVQLTSWTYPSRFKDYFIYNDQVMIYVFKEYSLDENTIKVTIREYLPQQIFHKEGLAHYNNYYYTTEILDENGTKIPLDITGLDYYYNYNPAVAIKNIDKEGNLVLTNESIGSIELKTYSPGNYHLGKVKISWIGSSNMDENATIVTIKSKPYDLKDESGKVFAKDIYGMYITNVQGLNVFQITNKENKVGILGPNGEELVPQIYDYITIVGTNSNDYYESLAFPIFFVVYLNDKCGAIDAKGKWVIPMGQEFIELCGNEFIVTNNDKVSLMSLEGKALIDGLDAYSGYSYDSYGYGVDCYSLNYSENGFHILTKNQKFGLVDKSFNVVIPFVYNSIYQISGTSNYIAEDTTGKFGIVDISGKTIVPFEYEKMISFDYSPNRLVVAKDGKEGVINESGTVLIPLEYYSIGTYSDWQGNLIYISDPDYQTNIIDTTGKSIIEAKCGYVYLYSHLMIISCGNEGQYDFYDMTGQMMYTKVAEYIDPYSCYDNIQIYETGSYDEPSFGAFDIYTGEDLMPAKFEMLYPFWIGEQMFYVAQLKGKIGIYSPEGTLLVKHKYTNLDNYYYKDDYNGDDAGYYVEVSKGDKDGKIIKLNW